MNTVSVIISKEALASDGPNKNQMEKQKTKLLIKNI
jgi:hypothetical protein